MSIFGADLLRGAAQEAAADLATFGRDAVRLRDLKLGTFSQAGVLGLVSRRLLLAADMPPRWSGVASGLPRIAAHEGWTRWVYSYAYWHAVRKQLAGTETWQRLTRGPTILLYHAIGSQSEPASRFVLPARRFEQHMRWLRARAYHIISLQTLFDIWGCGQLPPRRTVVVTLDDAYADAYTDAFPILVKWRIPATFFVVTQRIGLINDWEPRGPLNGRPLAAADQLRIMRDHGMELGAHSRTHVSLPHVSREQAEDEIRGSRADLEQLLGRPPLAFAYPFGHNTPAVQHEARRAGFLGACDVAAMVADPCANRFAVPRVELHGTWHLVHLALALWLGHVPNALAH